MDRSFTIKKGEVLKISGQVTDDRSLSDGGNGVVYLAYTDLGSGNTFSTDEYFVFDDTVDKSFDFEMEYTIPQYLDSRAIIVFHWVPMTVYETWRLLSFSSWR